MKPVSDDKAVYDLTAFGRVIVLLSVVLASTCYTATILVATTLLPQREVYVTVTKWPSLLCVRDGLPG